MSSVGRAREANWDYDNQNEELHSRPQAANVWVSGWEPQASSRVEATASDVLPEKTSNLWAAVLAHPLGANLSNVLIVVRYNVDGTARKSPSWVRDYSPVFGLLALHTPSASWTLILLSKSPRNEFWRNPEAERHQEEVVLDYVETVNGWYI